MNNKGTSFKIFNFFNADFMKAINIVRVKKSGTIL